MNHFEIDYETNSIKITCSKVEYDEVNNPSYGDEVTRVVNIKDFLGFCTVCMSSCQSENQSIDLTKYNIRYIRESYDHRFFCYGDLHLLVGEVYMLYEIMSRNLNPEDFKLHKVANMFVFINTKGYMFVTDRHLLEVFYVRYGMLFDVDLTTSDKTNNKQVSYDRPVKVGNVQDIVLKKGVCHPYVYLNYRDMTLSISLSEWHLLKRFCMNYVYSMALLDY